MGYTHYWYRAHKIDGSEFKSIVRDFKKIVPVMAGHGIPLAGPEGEGDPVLTDERISFNGRASCGHPVNTAIRIPWPADGAGGVGASNVDVVEGRWYAGATLSTRACSGDCTYETMDFPRIRRLDRIGSEADADGLFFNFCKTGFRPYDVAVTALLVIAAHHLGERIKVHSDGQQEHWFDGQMLCQMELGYGLEFHLPEDSVEANGG